MIIIQFSAMVSVLAAIRFVAYCPVFEFRDLIFEVLNLLLGVKFSRWLEVMSREVDGSMSAA